MTKKPEEIRNEPLDGQLEVQDPAPVDVHQDDEQPAVPPQAAPVVAPRVRAVWQTNFWGAKHGHEEELELTDTVAAAGANGKLILFDLETGDRIVADQPAPSAPRSAAPRPPRARGRAGFPGD